MALLNCPECNSKVSEFAECCQNCGCPINIIKENNVIDGHLYTIINGHKKDVTYFVNKILSDEWQDDIGLFNSEIMKELDVAMVGFVRAVRAVNGAPKEYNAESMSEWKQRQQTIQASKIHCPNCHGTNVKRISGTERAASVLGLGILSKKIGKSYKCLNCKYTW